MTIEHLSLAELLRLYRERYNLSQRQLALGLHLDPSLVSKWENQLRVPNIATIREIARALRLRADQEQNLFDARDGVVAEALALHELLSLYFARAPFTEEQILARLNKGTRGRLRAWRSGASIPTNAELTAIAQALEFDNYQIVRLFAAKPRLTCSPTVLEFILRGTGQIKTESLAELVSKGVEIAIQTG